MCSSARAGERCDWFVGSVPGVVDDRVTASTVGRCARAFGRHGRGRCWFDAGWQLAGLAHTRRRRRRGGGGDTRTGLVDLDRVVDRLEGTDVAGTRWTVDT